MIGQPYALAAAAVIGALAGWYVADMAGDNALLEFKESLRQQQDDQRDLTMRVESADNSNTTQSTARIDAQEAQRIVEVRYVDREIIKYRDRPADRRFVVTAEFLRIYNEAAGLSGGVSEASAARPAPNGAGD